MELIILIFFPLFLLTECRENYKPVIVNVTEGRSDLSMVGVTSNDDVIFRIIKESVNESFVAKATFIEQINITGWGHLNIESSAEYSDVLQAYFSGVLEGIITRTLIKAHWYNKYEGYCTTRSKYCRNLYQYLKDNFMSIVTAGRRSSGFIKMVFLQFWQIKGLQDGYDENWKTKSSDITEKFLLEMQNDLFKLYLLQIDYDLIDLSKFLGGFIYHSRFTIASLSGNGRCSALVKYINGSIYSAHVTWSSYNNMLRLTKLYNFPYRINENEKSSPLVPAIKLSFPSYPGQLPSLDDFYITSAGLVIMETTIDNYNKSSYHALKNIATEVVFSFARAQAANRLAMSGLEWALLFSRNNSGTYNNQWMIVDNNVMENHTFIERIPGGALYIVEQIPNLVIFEDVTQHLRESSYWPSYNLPYNKTIWNMGEFQININIFGDSMDYEKCPRAMMFKRKASNITDYESMMRFMRYNDFKHDQFSKCNCTPPYSAGIAISSREDLDLKDGTYPLSINGYELYGGIDVKLTTSHLTKSMTFIGINGPTYDQQPVFDWGKLKYGILNHKLHPQTFQFAPILTPFT